MLEKKLASLDEVSSPWVLFCITEKRLLGTDLAVEPKSDRKHKYIKLRKNKVIIHV